MKRRSILLLLLLCLLLTGCNTGKADPFFALRESYTAEVEGELEGMHFCVLVEAGERSAAGLLPVTVTFYAPDELLDTKIMRKADGEVVAFSGNTAVTVSENAFLALLDLLEPCEEIGEISLNDEGRSVVTCEGFSMEFLFDGTPYSVQREGVTAKIIRFKKGRDQGGCP